MHGLHLSVGITVLSFAALSSAYKLSQVLKCESWVYMSGLYAVGAASGCIALVGKEGSLDVPLSVWIMGAGGGVLGISSLLCFLRAMKLGGSLSLVNTIVQVSLCVPIVYSVCFLGEKLTALRVAGLVLFVVFLLLLNEPAKPKDEEVAE